MNFVPWFFLAHRVGDNYTDDKGLGGVMFGLGLFKDVRLRVTGRRAGRDRRASGG